MDPALELARRHGLELGDDVTVTEAGLDFRVVTARDPGGTAWILRVPRRPDVVPKIAYEAKVLAFVRPRWVRAVPDWKVITDELVAYPRLTDSTALEYDPQTHAVTWHVDLESPRYTESYAAALAELHALDVDEAAAAGLRVRSIDDERKRVADELASVCDALDVPEAVQRTHRAWIDDDDCWPRQPTFIHGDLYAAHTLVDDDDRVTGALDWSEAEVGDPSIDLTGHYIGFGDDGLATLLEHYAKAGGHVWPTMAKHIARRAGFAPIRYAAFALETGDDALLEMARGQLATPAD